MTIGEQNVPLCMTNMFEFLEECLNELAKFSEVLLYIPTLQLD